MLPSLLRGGISWIRLVDKPIEEHDASNQWSVPIRSFNAVAKTSDLAGRKSRLGQRHNDRKEKRQREILQIIHTPKRAADPPSHHGLPQDSSKPAVARAANAAQIHNRRQVIP